MVQLIKFIFKTTVALLLILVGAVVLVAIFINPNNYKTQIISFLENNIGYKVQINGPIQWSLTKDIVFYVRNVSISHKSHDKFPTSILVSKDLSFAISPVKTLLNKMLTISKLEFEDLGIYIFKNTDKVTNVDELLQKLKLPIHNAKNKILFENIVWKNSTVTLDDQFANKHIKITQLNLILKNGSALEISSSKINMFNMELMLESTLNIDFGANNLDINKSKIDCNGVRYTVTGNIHYKGAEDFDGHLQLLLMNLPGGIKSPSLDVKFIVNNKQIDLNSMLLQIDSGKVSGNVKISTLENKGEFDLGIQDLEFQKIIKLLVNANNDVDQKPSDQIAKPDDYAAVNLFKKIQLTGRIHGNNILIKPLLVITDLDLPIKSDMPGMFEVHKGAFNLGKATVAVNMQADLNKQNQLNMVIDAKDLDMPIVAKTFAAGTGIVNIKVTTAASNYQALLNNLAGNIDLVVANGKLRGVDFNNALTKSEKHLNDLFGSLRGDPKQDLKFLLEHSKKTVDNVFSNDVVSDFSVFKLQMLLKNGVDVKSSVLLKHQTYSVNGYGVINIPKNNLNYTVSAKLIEPPNELIKEVAQYMQVVPLSIKCSGNIDAVVFSADTKKYLLTSLQELQKIILKSKENNVVSGSLDDGGKDNVTNVNVPLKETDLLKKSPGIPSIIRK